MTMINEITSQLSAKLGSAHCYRRYVKLSHKITSSRYWAVRKRHESADIRVLAFIVTLLDFQIGT